MASETKRRFVRALRSLGRRELRAFVVVLWAARGWEQTEAETGTGTGTIEVWRERSGTRSVRVVAGFWALSAVVSLFVWPADADIVVTRGRLAAAAVERVIGLRSRATVEHVPADDLYTRFRYGLADDERDRLWEECLSSSEDSTALGWSLLPTGFSATLDRTASFPSIGTLLTAAFVGSVVVALVVTGVVMGPSAVVRLEGNPLPSADTGTTQFTATPVDVRTPEPESSEATRSAAVPAPCPAPPTNAPPAAIRPGIVETASTSGLEGWVIQFEGNLTDFDPNDESNRVSPAVRHLAVYETPSGRQYRLTIDRWQSAERAADRATQAERANERTPLVWGTYSVVVEPYTTDASDRTAADIERLLANVQTPDGITLGDRCVDALAGDA